MHIHGHSWRGKALCSVVVIFNNLPLKGKIHFDNNEEDKTQVKEFKRKGCRFISFIYLFCHGNGPDDAVVATATLMPP